MITRWHHAKRCKGVRHRRRKQPIRGLQLLEPRIVLAGNPLNHWLADDLVASLDDGGEVSSWVDSQQQAQAKQIQGSPRLVHDAIGGKAAVRFDASDGGDLLQVGLSENPMSQVGDFTVTVAFATSTELQGTDQEWYRNTGLVDGSALGFTTDWGISLNSLGQASVGLGGGFGLPSRTLYSAANGLNNGALQVVSFSRSGSLISVYVNELPGNQLDDASAAERARNEMVMGGLLTQNNYFTGDIAQVRVYDASLSELEIANLHTQVLGYYNNQLPISNDDNYAVDEDETLDVSVVDGVLANDTDLDNDPLTATLVDPPQHGRVELRSDGAFSYAPHDNYFGNDAFTYLAADSRPAETPAIVNIQIRPVRDPIILSPDFYSTNPNKILSVSASAGLLANDLNIDNARLSAVLASDVETGILTLNSDGSFVYDPQGINGVVRFDYQVDDEFELSETQTVEIIINTPPTLTADAYQIHEDMTLMVDVANGLLANDFDADGHTLTAVLGTAPKGELTLAADGSFQYTPPTDFFGLVLFTYQASDGIDETFDVFVQIQIHPVNDAPKSQADVYFAFPDQTLAIGDQEGVLRNDSDVDNENLISHLVRAPQNGQMTLHPDGSFAYTPQAGFEGIDTFTYQATDNILQSDETTVSIRVTSQPIIISEFLAANASILETRIRNSTEDRFRNQEAMTPDWIELRNLMDREIDLHGLHLTDDASTPKMWQFPANTVIPPEGYLLLFASGRDIDNRELDELSVLHTNFQLSSNGGYLALTNEQGNVIHEFAPGYPEQKIDISYGVVGDEEQTAGFFLHPTPGIENDTPRMGFVEDTQFSVDRGFFDEPFQLEITTLTPDATIRFTKDGTEPTEDHGLVYDGPIAIRQTTTLRAAAFRSGMLPTNVDTHTYFFLDDVLDQSSTPPEGFPSTWGGTFTDWGMDQNPDDLIAIAGDSNLTLDQARDVIKESLLSLPTMSVVTSVDSMFGDRNGIYSNTERRGEAWERPTSVEYIDPQGMEPGFQIDAGIRMQGFTSRNPSRNPKHSLRLVFRSKYGEPQLEYPLFGPHAANRFDTLVLRSNAQDAWVYDSSENRQGQFIRDQWARETQLAMGQTAAHGNWVHLYLNGLYWGVYNPTERPDASFNASYVGGHKDDYDIVKNHEEIIDGNGDAYQDLLTAIQNNPRNFGAGYRDFSNIEDYQRIQGNNPDGSRNPDYPVLIDVSSLIDYVIHGAYAAANDWPGNYYMGRDRTENSTGFKFFMWDNEHGMKPGVTTNRTVPHRRDNDSPTKFYHALRSSSEFRLLFADHLHRAFFNGGPLYVDRENPDWDLEHPERNVPAARWMEITGHIEQALIAEAARWGDVRRIQYTPHDQFQSLRNRLLRTWFPRRSEIVFDQFKRLDLYPDHAAPEFSQHGGRIDDAFRLEILNPNARGQVFYTMDGTDPRNSPTEFREPLALTGKVTVKSRVLLDGKWSALNEATFTNAISADSGNLRVSEVHYNPAAPTELEIAAGFSDNDEFEFMELVNISASTVDLSTVQLSQVSVDGDLQGVSFDFGNGQVTELAPGATVLVVENLDAFELRYGDDLPVAGQWIGKLSNNSETITIRSGDLTIQQFSYADDWHPSTDGDGFSLQSVDIASSDLDRWNRADGWKASTQLHGSPGVTVVAPIPGDSNHDGIFNPADLILVFQAGEFEDDIEGNSTFEDGDWNGDGDFTTADLVLVFEIGHYVAAARRDL